MVLAKEKNEELALYWLVRSVYLFPMNWGCWLEMTSLITRVEDVCFCNLKHFHMILTMLVESCYGPCSTEYCLIHVSHTYLS